MSDPRRRLTGVYAEHPEEMLQHAISLTLQLAAALVHLRAGAAALRTITQDAAFTRRAAALVMRSMLRQVVTTGPITREQLEQLARDVQAVTRES